MQKIRASPSQLEKEKRFKDKSDTPALIKPVAIAAADKESKAASMK
jgi:hypothetical protein